MLDNYEIVKQVPDELCQALITQGQFEAKAVLFAKGLKLKGLTKANLRAVGNEIVFIPMSDNGICAAFHFGALVFFNTTEQAQNDLYKQLEESAQSPFNERVHEVVAIQINKKCIERVVDDTLYIQTCTNEHLEVISQVLAKSVKLDQFEHTVADSFEAVEPIALKLRNQGKLDRSATQLLKQIGNSLLTEHEIVGRIEVIEKPNVLWEHTELEQLYNQLMEEFEIEERLAILDKKIELLARTAQTSLEVLQHRHSARLEWYIIILIMVSIVLEVLALIAGH